MVANFLKLVDDIIINNNNKSTSYGIIYNTIIRRAIVVACGYNCCRITFGWPIGPIGSVTIEPGNV